MKVIAWVTDRMMSDNHEPPITSGCILLMTTYMVSNGTLEGVVETIADCEQTEDGLKSAIRTAVVGDVNAKLGTTLVAADVRLV
jgi:hypothetical protein